MKDRYSHCVIRLKSYLILRNLYATRYFLYTYFALFHDPLKLMEVKPWMEYIFL